ncbi:MAG: mechanosensitive ion channel [Candidatus Dependentiae bacterium]|nr:mechanosensitive ion channel [Candidatus Dependentiae bacterium]
MNQAIQHNHFILSRHSIHIVPAMIIGVLIIIGTWYLNRVLQRTIIRVGQTNKLEEKLIKAIQKLTHIFIYSVGATLFLENLHIQMSALFGTLGVIAIGVGFALQKALANMTSGMFLLFYKPFFIGDYIVSTKPKFEGEIIDINLRLTTLKYKDHLVLVPNHTVYGAVVTVKNKANHS